MSRSKVINGLALICLLAVTAVTFQRVYAHGTMMMPPARAYNCYLEDPENPTSAACQAAHAISGSQAFIDWYEINQLPGYYLDQELVADGELCSASKEKYEGLDLPRNDWMTTTLSPDANGNYNFVYKATARHDSAYFKFYITNDSYDHSQPLNWSDLEETPFCTVTEPLLQGDEYTLECPLPPDKDGQHIIYNIWLRDDSDEAFYACSDVVLENTAGLPAPTPAPLCSDTEAWDVDLNYRLAGTSVSHNGIVWQNKWGGKGQEPGSAYRTWKYVYECSEADAQPIITVTPDPNVTPSPTPPATATPSLPACTAPGWDSTATYNSGDTVSYGSDEWYEWDAKWWSQGQAPGSATDGSNAWDQLDICSDPNATPVPTATNTPTAIATNTLIPTATNTPTPTPTSNIPLALNLNQAVAGAENINLFALLLFATLIVTASLALSRKITR